MKQILALIFVICLALFVPFYTIDFFMGQRELNSSIYYKNIQRWMESEDSHLFYPTLKNAMEDGVIKKYEYDLLQDISSNLDLERSKTSFLKVWNENKDRWEGNSLVPS